MEKVCIPLMVQKAVNLGESFKYDQVSYVDYAEGIYIGYKWYETADAENYWDKYRNLQWEGYDAVVSVFLWLWSVLHRFDGRWVKSPGEKRKTGSRQYCRDNRSGN